MGIMMEKIPENHVAGHRIKDKIYGYCDNIEIKNVILSLDGSLIKKPFESS